MIGYLNVYVKVTGKKDVYYASFTGDFGKPILQEDIDAMLETFKKAYASYDEIVTAEFCTKEEYEQEIADQDTLSVDWNDTEN
jgi:hypothetical protein